MPASIVQLTPFLQPFPYGRNGFESVAARYALETPDLKTRVEKEGGIKPDQPYGEIWFDTHENGPAYVEGSQGGGKKLRDLVRENPEFYLGKKLLEDTQMSSQYEHDVPYLFKVLSFDKPLPLQCHPDKKLGEKLKEQESKEKGKNEDFVDSNAKPEVGVAISDYFTAFVGFRPPRQLASIIESVPEFKAMFNDSTLSSLDKISSASASESQVKPILRALFDESINLSPDQVKPLVQRLSSRLGEQGAEEVFGVANEFNARGDANATEETEAQAMKRVWELSVKTFGEQDVGVLVSTCLMNLLRMKKGEGAWILADDLHAYVEGDIIECMANSDNMVAHGLGTEEQGGISTFVDMLSYRHLPASKLLLEYVDGSKLGKNGLTRYYKVPIAEFDLLSVSLSSSSSSETISPLDGPLTFVVTEGSVTVTVDGDSVKLSKGQAAFVKANSEILIESSNSTSELWGAFYQ